MKRIALVVVAVGLLTLFAITATATIALAANVANPSDTTLFTSDQVSTQSTWNLDWVSGSVQRLSNRSFAPHHSRAGYGAAADQNGNCPNKGNSNSNASSSGEPSY